MAQTVEDEEVVWHFQRIVSDGDLIEQELVAFPPEIDLDEDNLEDADGNRYYFVADLEQLETGEAVYDLRLVRYEPVYLDEQEILDAYLDVYPDATQAEIDAFQDERENGHPRVPFEVMVHEDLEDWLDAAGPTDTTEVEVLLVDDLPFDIPRLSSSVFDVYNDYSQAEADLRSLAIAQRKVDVPALRAPFEQDLEAQGATIETGYWLVNGLRATVTPAQLEWLAADNRVASLNPPVQIQPLYTADDGTLIRQAHQIRQFIDEGYRGGIGSGYSDEDTIVVGISDLFIDVDHPAWMNGPPVGIALPGGTVIPSSSRLLGVHRYDWPTQTWQVVNSSAAAATLSPSIESWRGHGTGVAGQLLADLTAGQDPLLSLSLEDERSGMTFETAFHFVENSNQSATSHYYVESMEFLLDDDPGDEMDLVDLANFSWRAENFCDPNATLDKAANRLYHAGIGLVAAAGQWETTDPQPACGIASPALAASTLTVAAIEPGSHASLIATTDHGIDQNGAAYVDLAAIGCRSRFSAPDYDDTYASLPCASSYAAPVVTGALAGLKHQMLEDTQHWGPDVANQPGMLYAMLLLGTDAKNLNDKDWLAPYDEYWGAGRLRARMFNAAGLDRPFHVRAIKRVLDDGEEAVMALAPDEDGVNQSIPNNADYARTVAWFFEPNRIPYVDGDDLVDDALQTKIGFALCDVTSGSVCVFYGDHDPVGLYGQKKRAAMDDVGGRILEARMVGIDVPESVDIDYFHEEKKRRVFVVTLFEDGDRNDIDGPSSDVE